MILGFVDTENNIIHRCDDALSLQENFDIFARKVVKQGRMEMCIGNVHLVQMQDVKPGKPLLHLSKERYGGIYWEVLPIPGLAWPPGLTYKPEGEENPQKVAME